jgi:hypothetical protein
MRVAKGRIDGSEGVMRPHRAEIEPPHDIVEPWGSAERSPYAASTRGASRIRYRLGAIEQPPRIVCGS